MRQSPIFEISKSTMRPFRDAFLLQVSLQNELFENLTYRAFSVSFETRIINLAHTLPLRIV